MTKGVARIGFPRCTLSLLILVALLIVACGAAAPAPEGGGDTPTAQAPASAPIRTPSAVAKPKALTIPETAIPTPTQIPADLVSARDTLTFVTSEEPTTIGAPSPNCGGTIQKPSATIWPSTL